jgi:hypothetical protein
MVRPGITGWAQVRYRYANDLDEEMEKLRYDLYYIKHYSVRLDLRILFETIRVVLSGREQPQAMDGATQASPGRESPTLSGRAPLDAEVKASSGVERSAVSPVGAGDIAHANKAINARETLR